MAIVRSLSSDDEPMRVILCVDAGGRDIASSVEASQASLVYESMTQVMQEFVDERGMLPFKKIVIVLTKADVYFLMDERTAEDNATAVNPWPRAIEVLTRPALKQLLKHLDSTEQDRVACGWSSAFGFIDGQSNFAPESEGLLTQVGEGDRATLYSKWRPFKLLDPFIFVSAGYLGGLVPYAKRNS